MNVLADARLRDKKINRAAVALLSVFAAVLLLSTAIIAQPRPREVLGFHPTDDRTIADWRQITDYFAKLDRSSDRVLVREIGKTTNGNPLIVAFISSPSNIKDLEKYRRISARLADPRTISGEAELNDLVKKGKTIVSIACSIHSTEIVASQMSMNLAFELATAKDAETKEILDNTILLLFPSSNPDGVDIVANWYRKTLGTKSEGTSPPELYHHYAGHDNNRDWFMLNLVETQAITKLFWQEWFPQLVYDVHQQGQNASRFIIPPFFDPPNPRVSPSILREVGLMGYKMASDLQAKGIEGVATNSTYDTWWHGGFRSAPYYHNSIGILSEAASTSLMTPVTVKREDLAGPRNTRGLPNLLQPATNYPDPWEGGTWRPADIAQIEMISSRALLSMAAKFRQRYLRNFYDLAKSNLTPSAGDPQAFIVTAGQPNTETISRFLEVLMAQGIEVYLMTNELYVQMAPAAGEPHEMPLNSFLIFVNQPQKNNVLALLEKQTYPDRRLPNGDAEAPYDVAGWTLPMQMGIECEPVRKIEHFDRDQKTLRRVENLNQARSILNLEAVNTAFAKKPNPLRTNPRIGLYRTHSGSMDEGWTRFVFDTFQIPFRPVVDADVRRGDLDLDAIVLPADSENLIVNGLNAERYPVEISGGLTAAGVENLKKYVENGGKLICFDDSCQMVINRFNLPLKNVVAGVRRNEFYNPGSIVKLVVNNRDPLARAMRPEVGAYFSTSSAFDLLPETPTGGLTRPNQVRIVAHYAAKDALMSGWMVGEKFINGKIALAEAGYGRGKIILFAFRPQHRAQSWGTFQFVFNALEK